MSQPATGLCKLKVLVIGALLLAQLYAAPEADAHDRGNAFHMTVISDAVFGNRVRNGDYADAIAGITAADVRGRDRFFASTNLCVALTKTGKLERAGDACEEAVRLAPADRASTKDAHSARSAIDRRYRALALSNRGVLRAIAGDESLAREDFESALDLRGGLSAPARNLAYLQNRASQAANAL